MPGGLKLPEIRSAIAAVPGVAGVHDLHVWSMATDDVSCTAHVELADGTTADDVRQRVEALLDDRFGIEHCTIQTERNVCEDQGNLHP